MNTTKQCFKCKEVKNTSNFWKATKNGDRLQHYCKDCQNARKRKDYDTVVRNTNYKKQFGISLQDYNDLLKKQKYTCALCHATKNECGKHFAVDHNHKTGKVRGLLCDKCNRGLGQFADSVRLLKKAINYLKKNN